MCDHSVFIESSHWEANSSKNINLITMKTIVVFTALLAMAVALPRLQRRQVELEPSQITLTRSLPYDGSSQKDYSFGYSQTDGQTRDEVAQIEVNDSGDTVVRVQGSYSWVNPEDGQVYSVTYFADENGFQPTGAHLPVAPAA